MGRHGYVDVCRSIERERVGKNKGKHGGGVVLRQG